MQEIPGALIQYIKSSNLLTEDSPPVFYIPVGIPFSLTVDGSQLEQETETSIAMIGPGYDLEVDEIKLSPEQQDKITFSKDGARVTYETTSNESPTITIGFADADEADYEFNFKGVDLDGGGTITVNLDRDESVVSLATQGTEKQGTYAILMYRIDDEGEITFYHDGIALNPSGTAHLKYKNWSKNGSSISLEIDSNGDGEIDNLLVIEDQEMPEQTDEG